MNRPLPCASNGSFEMSKISASGAFHQMSITVITCNVNNLDKVGRPGRRFSRQGTPVTVGHPACSVKGSLDIELIWSLAIQK